MPRKPSCLCGECPKCKRRVAARKRYQSKSVEERRAWVERRDKEKVRARDRARSRTPERREHNQRNTKRWREENPEKYAAQIAVNNAVRDGKLEREGCLFCDAPAHAHHHDYTKPLDVTWLCPRHHKLAHASEENHAP